jgi:hypothetical protein
MDLKLATDIGIHAANEGRKKILEVVGRCESDADKTMAMLIAMTAMVVSYEEMKAKFPALGRVAEVMDPQEFVRMQKEQGKWP